MTDRSRLRLVVLGVLVISLVVTLIGRLWYLQVIAAPQYRHIAIAQQSRYIVTQAPRGEIVDDKGRPLVTNKTAVVISVDRGTLSDQPNCALPVAPTPTSSTSSASPAPTPTPAPVCPVLKRLSVLLGTPYKMLYAQTTPCTYPFVKVKVHGKLVPRQVALPAHCYSGDPSQPIPVSQAKPTNAATRRSIYIQESPQKFPSVSAQTTAVRHYPQPQGAQASTILGYTAPITASELKTLSVKQQAVRRNSDVGVTGLEQYYNSQLSGRPGVRQITVDHVGNQTGVVKNTSPKQGDDLVTYLDAKAQADLETEVQDAINSARHNGYTGDYASGVVLNARNGGIVAMASEPTYNPNKPPPTLKTPQYNQISHSEGHPFFDKAYEGGYPPGSTFKPISASGMLSDGTIANVNTQYDCPTNFGGRHNYDNGNGAGVISLHEALVISCDTFFFSLGNTDWNRDDALVKQHKKPREGVQNLARDYGYGSTLKNGFVDLPNATNGHIADRANTLYDWKHNPNLQDYCSGAHNSSFTAEHRALDLQYCKYGGIFFPGDQMNEDVGQGTVDASPLQVATAYAAIANGGTVFEPRVVKAIVSPTGKLIKRIKPPVRDHIPLPASDLAYIRSALYGVTHESNGTAAVPFANLSSQINVGGKTGTAELTGTNENGSWFASFGGPTGQEPQYVTVIEVDKAPEGADGAAPFVEGMWQDLYGLGGQSPVFKNGVPPTALPKVGAAAIQQKIQRKLARQKARRKAARIAARNPTGTSTTPPTGTSTSPTSSPTTSADGLPPALIERRFGALR